MGEDGEEEDLPTHSGGGEANNIVDSWGMQMESIFHKW